MRLGNILDIEFWVMNACIMNHRVWISVLYFFWYFVHSYSLLGNLRWGFQKMVTKMFICNMSYSVKKKKRNLFIPLPLECAKKWNSEILITRPRVQDAQFDTILTEIKACFNLWSMHALSRLVASILEMPHQGGRGAGNDCLNLNFRQNFPYV